MRSSLCLALLALAWGCGSEVPFPPGGGGIPPIIGVGGSAGSGGTGGMGGTGGSAGSGGAGGSGGTYALCLEIDCGDGNDCTRDVCDPADGSCSNPNEPDATPCELIGQPGVCVSGTCVIGTLCDGFDCSDGNQCTQDVCNPADGSCSNPEEPIGTPCDEGGIPGSCVHGVCDIST